MTLNECVRLVELKIIENMGTLRGFDRLDIIRAAQIVYDRQDELPSNVVMFSRLSSNAHGKPAQTSAGSIGKPTRGQ